MKHKQTLM